MTKLKCSEIVTCLAKTSVTMKLVIQSKRVPVFYHKGFYLPVSSRRTDMLSNVNIYLCCLKWNQHDKVLGIYAHFVLQIKLNIGSLPMRLDVIHTALMYSISQEYAHGFVVLCLVVVMQSFIMNSLEVFIHIHQGCFAGTGAIVRLPQCQWSKPDGYGKISQCITTTKHSKAKTVCIFLGIYCTYPVARDEPWIMKII